MNNDLATDIRSLIDVAEPVSAGEAMALAAASRTNSASLTVLEAAGSDASTRGIIPLGQHKRLHQKRPVVVMVTAVAAALLLVGLLTSLTLGQHSPTAPAEAKGSTLVRQGTWQLVDTVSSGTWQEHTDGPPPGSLSCASSSTCYKMSGEYASSSAAAPLSDNLYVSTDVGASWSEFSMPSGFQATSPLACPAVGTCVAGGTYQGKAVLVTTSDGGRSFAIDPLPADVGELYSLSCPSVGICGGLAATSSQGINHVPVDATFLSTSDGGASFSDAAILPGESMDALSCSTSLDCTAIGRSDAVSGSTSAVAVTTNGGQTWDLGVLPSGFNVGYYSELSCSDALHCSLIAEATTGVVILSSTDGGLNWASDTLPTNVPQLDLMGISCPTDEECWASGSKGSSPVLLGTTDGGSTWSNVTFTTPVGAPNYKGQSYLSMGPIDCPTAGVCVATGAVAQGAATAPTYDWVNPQMAQSM